MQQVTGAPESAGLRAHSTSTTTNIGSGIDLTGNGGSTFTANGMRYVYANLEVRNAQSCGTPGSCTAYATAAQNLTLVAAETSGTLAQSAVSKVKLFTGSESPDDAAIAPTIVPTDGVAGNGNDADKAVYPEPGLESLQVFSESEVAAMTPLTGVTSLLPYGYVVKNLHDATTRTLPASPATGDFEGGVTIAVAFPTQKAATDNPFSISLVYQPVTDSNTRVTQSVEEDTQRGDATAAARAAALGSTDLAVLGSGHTTATNTGDPICTVRTAGTAAAPSAYLVNAGTRASLASLPYNLTALSPTAALNAGFCAGMQTPSGIYSQFVVAGGESGQRTATGHYSGVFSGGGSNVLSFQPTQPFFTGERISLTATSALTSNGGQHPAAFVGESYAGGAVPSTGSFTNFSYSKQGADAFNSNALADLDGDGILDDVVDNQATNAVQIFPGNGDGTFAYPLTFSFGTGNFQVVATDINGDGKPDLAVLSQDQSVSPTVYKLHVLYNQGDFTFTESPGGPYSLGNTGSTSLAVADVNNDGKPDIAVLNSNTNTVTMLTQTFSHGFNNNAVSVSGAGTATVVRAADLNGDGDQDLVVGYTTGAVRSYLGTGFATFGSAVVSQVTNAADSNPGINQLALADVTGDGKPDLIAAAETRPTVMTGAGNGAFTTDTTPFGPVNNIEAYGIGVTDINGDGHPDFVAEFENTQGPQVSAYLNNGFGTAFSLQAGTYFDSRLAAASTVSVGDVNGDGRVDVVVSDGAGPTPLTGDGTGVFTGVTVANEQRVGTASGQPAAEALADFDGDGNLDVATANANASVTVFLGNGSGGSSAVTTSVPNTPVALVAADFDGDGKPDLAVVSASAVTFLKGTGTGSFTVQTTVTAGTGEPGAVVGDVNGDGRPDLVLADTGSTLYTVLVNTGGFAFTANAVSGTSTDYGVDTGDFNGDGKLDLVFTTSGSYQAQVYLGNGDGTFTLSGSYPAGTAPRAVVVADLNGDLRPDIVVADAQGRSVTELLALPTGGFSATTLPTPSAVQTLAVGDVNGDGHLDVVAGSTAVSTVTTFFGSATGLAGPGHRTGVPGAPVAVALGDLAGTHKLGLVVASAATQQVWFAQQR